MKSTDAPPSNYHPGIGANAGKPVPDIPGAGSRLGARPLRATAEGRVRNGKVVDLKVLPRSREKDVVIRPLMTQNN